MFGQPCPTHPPTRLGSSSPALSFVLLSDFVIRHSSFTAQKSCVDTAPPREWDMQKTVIGKVAFVPTWNKTGYVGVNPTIKPKPFRVSIV